MFETPVLLITFNRPKLTQRVYDEIERLKPKNLFVFQDGPRVDNLEDIDNCNSVREILCREKKWDCNFMTFFSEKNLGCGKGPSSAISWLFSHVDRGIILEDDCVPVEHFFNFCSDLLTYYEKNDKISFIGGTNFIRSKTNFNDSYYFSNGHHGTWGWATWKRTWKNFNYYLDDYSSIEFNKVLNYYFSNLRIKEYWNEIFKNVKKDRFNDTCWDYQFYFCCWKEMQLAIIPNENLVKNIGTGEDATHTNEYSLLLHRETSNSNNIIKHPKNITLDKRTDADFHKQFIQKNNFGIKGLKRLPFRINKRIKRLIGKEGSWFRKNNNI